MSNHNSNGHQPRTRPNDYDDCVARANAALWNAYSDNDPLAEWLGVTDAKIAEADLLAQICEYRKSFQR